MGSEWLVALSFSVNVSCFQRALVMCTPIFSNFGTVKLNLALLVAGVEFR